MGREALDTGVASKGLPENLEALLGKEDFSYYYKGDVIPISAINILPQPRQTFTDVSLLASDIASKRLLNPPTVARFNEKSCIRYLEVINILWGTNFRIQELHSVQGKRGETFFVLLAGERRLRALWYLWAEGCEKCQEEYGREPEGTCFHRHFGDDRIEVRLCSNIPPLAALFLQFSENTHIRVPPHEEAHAYYQLLRLIKEADPKYTLAQFARNVGRNPDTVRNAIKYCTLPLDIQKAVEKGLIPYGIGLEFARLHENGVNEEELHWWLNRVVTANFKVPQFRDLVSGYLRVQNSGQMSLLEVMEETQRMLLERSHRLVVGRHVITAVHLWIDYLKRVLRLFEEGRLGKSDSPFSERSPIRVFGRFVDTLEQVLPHLKGLISENKCRDWAATIQQGKQFIALFGEDTEEC